MHDDDRRPLEPWEEDEAPAPAGIDPHHPLAAELAESARDAAAFEADAPPTFPRPPRPPDDGPVVLDARQAAAIRQCDEELYTNISGTAGVGKTLVAREIANRPGVVLAATTGIASVNLGEGTTINALLKYFDTDSLRDAYAHGALQAQVRRLRRSGIRRILIDEKSMMQGEQLTLITRAVREVNEGGVYALEDVGGGDIEDPEYESGAARDKDLPPIGITLVGDFGQLPPVPEKDPDTLRNRPLEYAFDSPEWPLYAAHTTTLETIYRQDDQAFVGALHAIRKGDVRAAVNFFTADRFARQLDLSFTGSTIFAKNVEVDRHNLLMLDKLQGAPMVHTTLRTGKQRGDWKQIPDTLRLKVGALVMVLANRREYADEYDSRGRLVYANGDLGILREQSGVGWVVTLQRTGGDVLVVPVTRENTIPLEVGRRKAIREAFLAGRGPDPTTVITEEGKGRQEIVGTVTYMPLRAAYGCTVHKTQGLTLDKVQVNIRDPFFRHSGMLFVALSRARTAEGLRIVGDQRGFVDRVRVEPRVQPWL